MVPLLGPVDPFILLPWQQDALLLPTRQPAGRRSRVTDKDTWGGGIYTGWCAFPSPYPDGDTLPGNPFKFNLKKITLSPRKFLEL